MNVTLRIKRKYFDLILSKQKRIEFRDVKPFYERLFERSQDLTTLTLHYQQQRKLVADITDIKIVSMRTAKRLSPIDFENVESDIVFSEKVYAIFLKSPRLVRG